MQVVESQMLLTPQGKEELAAEVACLEQIRLDLLTECQGPTNESTLTVQNQLAAVDREIAQLRRVLQQGVIVDDSNLVAIGSQVTIADDSGQHTIVIGGPVYANPRLGRVSYESTVAKAVLGHIQGDELDLSSPLDHQRIRIVSVRQEP